MKDIEIKISKETRKIVEISKLVIGNDGENLQGNLVFSFSDEFVKGQARLEYVLDDVEDTKNKKYQLLTQENETYKIPIKSVLTKQGKLFMQLVITEGINEEEIPVFKSNVFFVKVNKSINAQIEEPDEYSSWIEIANTKLNQLDNLDISAIKANGVTTITITKKDGTQEIVEIYDGKGADSGTIDYNKLVNKPQINNVELDGNKTLEELGIQPKGDYANKSDLPTKTSDLTNDSGFINEIPSESDPTVPTHVKNITEEDITNWNSKVGKEYVDEKVLENTIEKQGIYFLDLYEYIKTLLTEVNNKSKSTNITVESELWNSLQEIAFGNDLKNKIIIANIYGDQMGVFYGHKISDNQYVFDCEFIYKDELLIGTHNFKFNFSIKRGINWGGEINETIWLYRKSMNLLTTDNNQEYAVNANYHPAHKKYVDDTIAAQIGDINTILATLTEVSE